MCACFYFIEELDPHLPESEILCAHVDQFSRPNGGYKTENFAIRSYHRSYFIELYTEGLMFRLKSLNKLPRRNFSTTSTISGHYDAVVIGGGIAGAAAALGITTPSLAQDLRGGQSLRMVLDEVCSLPARLRDTSFIYTRIMYT